MLHYLFLNHAKKGELDAKTQSLIDRVMSI